MKRLSWLSVVVGALVLGVAPSFAEPGYAQLEWSARQLAHGAEAFEDAVDRRFNRSPVLRAADRFAEIAEDFYEEVEDRDIRDMRVEFSRLQNAYARLQRAYGQCAFVPRDPYLQRLWYGLSAQFQQVQRLVRGAGGGVYPPRPYPQPRPRPFPRPFPRQPRPGFSFSLEIGR